MSNHYEWGNADTANYGMLPASLASVEWDLRDDPDRSWVLGMFNENGDGLILQTHDPDELVTWATELLEHVRRVTAAALEAEQIIRKAAGI